MTGFLPNDIKDILDYQQTILNNFKPTFSTADYVSELLMPLKSIQENIFNLTDISQVLPKPFLDFQLQLQNTLNSFVPKIDFNLLLTDVQSQDFRIDVKAQELDNSTNLIEKQLHNISKPQADKFEVELDKLISEPFVDIKNYDSEINNGTDIRSIISEIYESQKRQEESFYEIIKNSKQDNPPEKLNKDFFNDFRLLLILIFGIVTKPKEIYEGIMWINDILNTLINNFFS